MRRITGTHVYSFVKCARLAALDLHLPRSERRPPHPWEEFAARRGRDFEDVYVAALDVATPDYPERDFEAGAAATLELLRRGAPLIHQAVLMDGDRLGLPDLLRKVPGPSALGDFHYEVLDVKTSGRPRSDQVLQVVFYSRLLGGIQERAPEHGALILKDHREERFAIRDFDAVCADVERELLQLREPGAAESAAARASLQAGCSSCHWDHRCLPALAAADDLSLVQGMTSGVRAILEELGCRTVADLATFHPDSARARGQLDAALLRRLRKAAQAAQLGHPIVEARPRGKPLEPAVFLHVLGDPFADRVLAFAALRPAAEGVGGTGEPGDDDGVFACALPRSRDEEWSALQSLLGDLPRSCHVLHFGTALPRWYESHAFDREADVGLAARFVDLQRRLRAAVLFPAPVFTFEDFVRHGLGRDPDREGRAAAAALWVSEDEDGDCGRRRLERKARADLRDLRALERRYLGASAVGPGAVGGDRTKQEGELGADAGTEAAAIPRP